MAVAAPDELAVAETLDLRRRLLAGLGLDLDLCVVDSVLAGRFAAAEERRLRALAPFPGRRAALFAATRARHQRHQLAHLRAGLDGVPVTTLPLVFAPALDLPALERLSRRLDPPRVRQKVPAATS